MKELKFNIQYMLKRKEFYLAIIISYTLNLLQAFLCVEQTISNNIAFEKSASGEFQSIFYNINVTLNVLIIIIFPILFSIIFSDSDVLDKKRKTVNLLYLRLDMRKNILSRTILAFSFTILISLSSFLFNYIVLRIIYGSGNLLTYSQQIAFSMKNMSYFLEDIRLLSSTLFIFVICLSVSLILGLLSMFAYLVANIIDKRVLSYFFPLIFLILWEVVIDIFEMKEFSFITFLQPAGTYTLSSYLVGILILIVINILLLIPQLHKRDIVI